MGIVLGGDLIATGQVNRIKGLEYNVCLYIKYQPHPAGGPVIRTRRLNVLASRSLAGGTTFTRSDCDSWLGVFTLIRMSTPLTSFISPFERFHTGPTAHFSCWHLLPLNNLKFTDVLQRQRVHCRSRRE